MRLRKVLPLLLALTAMALAATSMLMLGAARQQNSVVFYDP